MSLSSALLSAEKELKNNGYDSIIQKTSPGNDGNSFYRIISKHLCKGDNPKLARKRISEIQSHNKIRYQLHQPESKAAKLSMPPTTAFVSNLDKTKTNFRDPEPRDVYAASEMLKMTIVLLIYHDDQKEFERKDFLYENDENSFLYILQIPTYSNDWYIELEMSTQYVETQDHYNHEYCHETQYRKQFTDNSKAFPGNLTAFETVCADDETWNEIPSITEDSWSLFRCISFAIYGTQDLFPYIMNLSMQLEENEEYVKVFTKMHYRTGSLKEQIKDLKIHANSVRSGTAFPGISEIYAASSLLQTDIYVFNDYEGVPVWRIYQPIAALPSPRSRKSFIMLNLKKNLNGDAFYYKLMIPRSSCCSCSISPPTVRGYLQEAEKQFNQCTKGILKKRPTCCPGLEEEHRHLLTGPYQKMPVERQCEAYPLDQSIVEILKKEGRKIDTTGKGTFDQCIHMEVHGNKGDDQHFTIPSPEKIIQKANELQVPIFILRANETWTRYMPGKTKSSQAFPHTLCRYYVTMFLDEGRKYFSRVIPIEGCNCQMIPPQILRIQQSQNLFDRPIPRSELHFPLIEFFNDETDDAMELDEVRKHHQIVDFDEIEEATHRSDMENRDIDVVHPLCDNLFSCLSKEIFGSEYNYDLIREHVCDELLCHPKVYKSLMLGIFKNEKEFVEIHSRGVDKAFHIQDVDISAAATFFQTTIYVLVVETDGSSTWKEYSQLRRKALPPTFPKRISKCRQMNQFDDYYITLLMDPSGRYHRIVPKYEKCNCCMPRPTVPGKVDGNAYFVATAIETMVTMVYRNLRSTTQRLRVTLKLWMTICNELIDICETINKKMIEDRKGVNTATIVGGGAGIVGGAMAIVGAALAPVTAGASLGLIIAGGIIGFAGSATAAGSKVTEAVLVKKALTDFHILVKLFEIITERLNEDMETFEKAREAFDKICEGASNISSLENDNVIFEPGALTFLGLRYIPIVIVRISLRSLSVVLGSVFGGVSMLLDIGLIAYAIHNKYKGNKTAITDELTKTLLELRHNKTRLRTFECGNKINE